MSNRDTDASYDKSLQQWFDFAALEWTKNNLNTAMPGIVESYDAETKRATVRPAIKLLLNDEQGTTIAKPAIQNVPVFQPSGGKMALTIPIQEGDGVLLLFSQRGLEQFKETFEEADPSPNAFFDPRDCIAMPGFGSLRINPVSPAGIVLQDDDGSTYINVQRQGETGQMDAAVVRIRSQGKVIVISQDAIEMETANGAVTVRISPQGTVSVVAQSSISLEGGSETLVIR